jgi:SAM-dependent methyltransferase
VTTKQHWDRVYSSRRPTEVSWYEPSPLASLSLISESQAPTGASIIDVGGGASTLVDQLLDAGYTRLTVLDIAGRALEQARERLGARSSLVTWLEGDVLTCDLPPHSFDIWHDRAVFHFLTDAEDQRRYAARARRALRHGGELVIATFASDGPNRCSGLDVARYAPDELAARFAGFDLVDHRHVLHRTPAGVDQRFVYCRLVQRATEDSNL